MKYMYKYTWRKNRCSMFWEFSSSQIPWETEVRLRICLCIIIIRFGSGLPLKVLFCFEFLHDEELSLIMTTSCYERLNQLIIVPFNHDTDGITTNFLLQLRDNVENEPKRRVLKNQTKYSGQKCLIRIFSNSRFGVKFKHPMRWWRHI